LKALIQAIEKSEKESASVSATSTKPIPEADKTWIEQNLLIE
jgi:predicted RNA-binding protein